MTNLEVALEELKEDLLEMTRLVQNQLTKCKDAAVNNDIDLAKEVSNNEKRINAMDLKIDRECEDILALHTPVASDLRFVLAAIKICSNLERIGDNVQQIDKSTVKIIKKADIGIIKGFKILSMFDMASSMLEDARTAMEEDDSKMARKVFKKDDFLNDATNRADGVAVKLIKEAKENPKIILELFSIVRKLERVGDLNMNLAEEIIFHLEAKVLRHKKPKKKSAKQS
jgi:phosphate transport system protein